MNVAFEPLGNMVLIHRLDPTKKIGSIFVPDTSQDAPNTGTVIAVGPGRTRDDGTVKPISVAVGDTVVIEKWAGFEITLGGAEFVIISEDSIFGRIPK